MRRRISSKSQSQQSLPLRAKVHAPLASENLVPIDPPTQDMFPVSTEVPTQALAHVPTQDVPTQDMYGSIRNPRSLEDWVRLGESVSRKRANSSDAATAPSVNSRQKKRKSSPALPKVIEEHEAVAEKLPASEQPVDPTPSSTQAVCSEVATQELPAQSTQELPAQPTEELPVSRDATSQPTPSPTQKLLAGEEPESSQKKPWQSRSGRGKKTLTGSTPLDDVESPEPSEALTVYSRRGRPVKKRQTKTTLSLLPGCQPIDVIEEPEASEQLTDDGKEEQEVSMQSSSTRHLPMPLTASRLSFAELVKIGLQKRAAEGGDAGLTGFPSQSISPSPTPTKEVPDASVPGGSAAAVESEVPAVMMSEEVPSAIMSEALVATPSECSPDGVRRTLDFSGMEVTNPAGGEAPTASESAALERDARAATEIDEPLATESAALERDARVATEIDEPLATESAASVASASSSEDVSNLVRNLLAPMMKGNRSESSTRTSVTNLSAVVQQRIADTEETTRQLQKRQEAVVGVLEALQALI
eukprot:TRINITY_DN10320_c0_g1_i1.p1 TRINITY_DN10320_c0_g1~~TRINITY_DN10320_c0_g1_i1.p1  ORF type:complete len:532 (-),score=126.97 TRINITY_DN10320_c0_g1_i1:68-1663(-)